MAHRADFSSSPEQQIQDPARSPSHRRNHQQRKIPQNRRLNPHPHRLFRVALIFVRIHRLLQLLLHSFSSLRSSTILLPESFSFLPAPRKNPPHPPKGRPFSQQGYLHSKKLYLRPPGSHLNPAGIHLHPVREILVPLRCHLSPAGNHLRFAGRYQKYSGLHLTVIYQ